MMIIFNGTEIWDSSETMMLTKNDPIPIYAIAYIDTNSPEIRWWCWYHSWNPIEADDPRITESGIGQMIKLLLKE